MLEMLSSKVNSPLLVIQTGVGPNPSICVMFELPSLNMAEKFWDWKVGIWRVRVVRFSAMSGVMAPDQSAPGRMEAPAKGPARMPCYVWSRNRFEEVDFFYDGGRAKWECSTK